MDNGALRIRDLASASLLDRSRLLAGRAGLDRPVVRVVVRDVGPGTQVRAREGDLVVARRAGIPGGGEGRQLVSRLAELGAAGLVFVDGHYLTGTLAGVRATADETGLPLFALSHGSDAAAAGAALEAALAGGGAAAAAGAIAAAATLTRAAGAGGVGGVVEALAAVTGLGVVLQDAAGRRLIVAGRTEGPSIAVHVVAGGELALHGSGGGVLAEPLLAQAAALVTLESGRGDPVRASRDRRDAERVRRFLATSAGDEPAIVLVVAGGEPALVGRLRELGATCSDVGDDLVALLPAPVVIDRLAVVVAGTAWGAGSASGDGPRGLAEARAARELGRLLGRPPVYAHVRVADSLLRALGPDGAAALADEIVGSLSPELLDTLTAVLESGLSVAAAADRLYVHKNTVRYRLRRIEKLTGRRTTNLADRLELEGAVVANMVKNPLDGG